MIRDMVEEIEITIIVTIMIEIELIIKEETQAVIHQLNQVQLIQAQWKIIFSLTQSHQLKTNTLTCQLIKCASKYLLFFSFG